MITVVNKSVLGVFKFDIMAYIFDMELITLTLYCMQIEPQLLSGKNVMISAHGNSLTSIIMYLDKLTSQKVIDQLFMVITIYMFKCHK